MQRIGIKSGRKSTICPFPQALPCKVTYFTKSIYNPIQVFSIRTPLPPLFLIRCSGKRFPIPGGTDRLFSFRHSLPFAPSSQTERHPRKRRTNQERALPAAFTRLPAPSLPQSTRTPLSTTDRNREPQQETGYSQNKRMQKPQPIRVAAFACRQIAVGATSTVRSIRTIPTDRNRSAARIPTRVPEHQPLYRHRFEPVVVRPGPSGPADRRIRDYCAAAGCSDEAAGAAGISACGIAVPSDSITRS